MNNYMECIYPNKRVVKIKLESDNPFLFNLNKNIIAFRIFYNGEFTNWIYMGKRINLFELKKMSENPYYKMIIPILEKNHLSSVSTSSSGLVTMDNNGITYEEYISQILRDRGFNKYRVSNLVRKSFYVINPSKLGDWINLVNMNRNNIKNFLIIELSFLIIDALNNGGNLDNIIDCIPIKNDEYKVYLLNIVNTFYTKDNVRERVIA